MSERTVFLCSPLTEPCMLTFALFTTCLDHLTAAHPEHANVLRDHGRRAFEALPIAAIQSTAVMPSSTQIFVCGCHNYFTTIDEVQDHYQNSGAHAHRSAEVNSNDGNIGFLRWLIANTRHIRIVNPATAHPVIREVPNADIPGLIAVAPGAEVPDEYPELLVRRANGGSFTIRFTGETVRGIAALMTVARGAGD